MNLSRYLLLAGLAAMLCAAQEDWSGRPRRAERSHDYDVLHYRIQLSFDEAARTFQGETLIRLRPLRDGFDTVVLDAETFRVTSAGALRFEQTPGKLTIHLGRTYRYHEEVSFTVAYRADNVAIDATAFGMPRAYGLGLRFEPKTESHPPLIRSLSFPEGARHWFPCYDHPNDKATHEIIATVRAGYQVIANGALRSVTENRAKGEKTFHWAQTQPHSTYLYAFIAGPYVQVRDTKGALPISYWVYPKDEQDATRSFGKTRDVIEFFNREFGYAYPWAKYDQITLPNFGGGAECTSATVIGDNVIHDARADQDYSTHWLVAHEAAHQWWGNLVTMRDWSHTWLNESFATYYEYFYLKHLLGEDGGALDLLNKKRTYLREAGGRYKRPIVLDRWEWPNQNFDRHSYQKGAVVIGMLRDLMGEEPFRRTIAHYLKKHAFGSADTHDLLVAIREASGQVLDWFFEQWIFRAGHPVLDISYVWDSGTVRLKVRQKQEELYVLPVSIGIATAAAKRVEQVWIRQREETFAIPSGEKPMLVRFDEKDVLLAEVTFAKSKEELLYQLGHDNAMGRMQAASALQELSADEAVADGLRKAAVSDAFWAVRREALVVGDASLLRGIATNDRSSGVRAAALVALNRLRDASLAGFFEQRFRMEDSYLVQAEAVRALGKLGTADGLLREAAAMKSPFDVVGIAAREALKR